MNIDKFHLLSEVVFHEVIFCNKFQSVVTVSFCLFSMRGVCDSK